MLATKQTMLRPPSTPANGWRQISERMQNADLLVCPRVANRAGTNTTRAIALAPCPSRPLVPHDMRGRGARHNRQDVRTGAHTLISLYHISTGKPGSAMAQSLGNAEPPMHHLIMGGPAPNGAWRQVTFLLTVPLPRTLCLALCKTHCSGRARAGFSFPTVRARK